MKNKYMFNEDTIRAILAKEREARNQVTSKSREKMDRAYTEAINKILKNR